MNRQPERPHKIQLMAHRGGEGQWPSNTLYAFEKSVVLGAEALEMDVHSTRDGVLVVRHDPVVETTTNGQGAIRDLTLAEIKKLDAGYTWTNDGGKTFPFRGLGITIPTFEEILQAFPHLLINIDIKPREPQVVDAFCKLLRDHQRLELVRVGSFHDRQLQRFRQLCPEVATAAGVMETRIFYFLNLAGLAGLYHPRAQAFQVPEFSGRLHVVTPGFIRAAHAQGIEVHVWTVDEIEDMRRLIEWGVDGLITDFPERLKQVLSGAS